MRTKYQMVGIVLIAAFAAIAPALRATDAPVNSAGTWAESQDDRQMQSDLAKGLNTNRFRDVHVSVSNGVIHLSGSVQLFADKEEADRKAHRMKNATSIQNEIRVAGPQISDQELQATLIKKLQFDRVGYGTTTFNAISVGVTGGSVILGGHAYGPTDKYSALSLVSYTPGVQDVIDEIEVDPASPMDDRIRLNVAGLIYGYPALMKYSIDPGRPIRISVQNGNVTLYGVVDSAADRDMAFIRANGAQGVFRVTNELQVDDDRSEHE